MMTFLPETKEQWELIKEQFLTMKDIEDTPETWTFILSQLQGTKMPELMFDTDLVWHHYKRWKIATVLQNEKQVYIEQLKAKLIEGVQRALGKEHGESSPDVPEGSFHSEGDVPALPILETGMV